MRLSDWLHLNLPRIWSERGPVAWALRPLATLYGALFALRGLAYAAGLLRQHKVPALVIVVGNVVAGGAGKTPVTIAVAQHLLRQGWRVGVISRGHGRRTQDTRAVTADSHPLDVGDEPLLIHQATGLPVWVAQARTEAAKGLLHTHPQVQILLCDDGLQHLALARDLEICVMDERGVGNGWLLPAGPLREPWPRPVDMVLHTTHAQSPSDVPGHYQAPRQLASHAIGSDGRRVALSTLAQSPTHAVAGLARPEAFFEMLRQAGMNLASTLPQADHHNYENWQSLPERTWLCTEKDAAKLWRHEPGAWAVPLVVQPESAFWTALDARIQALLPR
jgi:tetraacyldisaccharide 4'-kinase